MRHSFWISAFLVLAGLAGLSGCGGTGGGAQRVVLYCAQDREFAEGLLADFTKEAGLPVEPTFDTEANKSVALAKTLVAEKNRPRCDVFWNNEILSSIRLQREGLLEAYDSPAAKPFPATAKASDHTWHAFATRARVLIVNPEKLKDVDRPQSLLDLADPRYKDKVVMAKPLFGTSATQAACLFEVLGPEKAKAFYQAVKANGVHIAPGNKQVAEWVGRGRTPNGVEVAVGVTDTDDAIDELNEARAADIIYPDQDASRGEKMGTLFLPNTVCILKGSPNPQGARKLVDYLLSPAVEKRLAEGPSVQAPLNPEVKAKLPPKIRAPHQVRAMKVDFEKAADLWEQAQEFVTKEFAGP